MNELTFSWDENKNKANQKKHGISFEEARSVFYDDYARLIPDPDHSDDEERFLIVGLSVNLKLLIVCHCYREDEQVIRIISARKTTKSEQRQYEEFI